MVRTPDFEMRIRAWPHPQALVKQVAKDWKAFRPEFRLLKPADGSGPMLAAAGGEHARRQAFAEFRASIPPPIVEVVERFRSHQWNLLELLDCRPEAMDLLRINPALAFCLANCDQFRRWTGSSPAVHASFVAGKRQRDILGWLGFPATEAVARIFRKIPPDAITPSAARVLRHALRAEPGILKLLAHQPVVNAGVLALVTNLKLLAGVTPALLGEVAADTDEAVDPRTADLLLDVVSMLWDLGRPSRLPRFESIASVRRYHDRLAEEHRRIAEESEMRRRTAVLAARPRAERTRPPAGLRDFPPPPLPGTDDIVPLTSPAALREEGQVQQNCVGSYARRVRSGSIYVYSVLRPERATLAIRRGPDGFWRIAELRAEKNRPVSLLTEISVQRWLARHGISV